MKISVIIPTYNRSKTIERAIKSVLIQNISDMEILICDDGSTDNTKEVINQLIKIDQRIKFIESRENSGLPSIPRNRGVKLAKGEWLAFLDSDDEWLSGKLKKQLDIAEKHNVDAVCTNGYKIRPKKERVLFHKNGSVKEKIIFNELVNVNYVINSSVLIKKELFDLCEGFSEKKELKAMEDYGLWLKVLTLSDFLYLEEPLVNYYDNPIQSIRGESKDNFQKDLFQKKIIFKDLNNWVSSGNKIKIKYKILSKMAGIKLSVKIIFHKFKQILKKIFNHKIFLDKIKQIYNVLYLKKKELDFYNTPSEKCLKINYSDNELINKKILDIGSIAFNNDRVIEYQIKLIKKNLKDAYNYTIFDNSTDIEISKKIFNICREHNVSYLKLPKNHFKRGASHGTSMNWIYKNYFTKRKPKYFGLIDHDIFPIKPTSIIEFLKKQPAWGHLQERQDMWYLWGNFCFFNFNAIKTPPNFSNGKIQGIAVDTGGLNWENIYSKIRKESMIFPKHVYKNIREGNDPHSDMVEYIGDWLHLFNSSNWKEVKNREERELKIKEIINNLLSS